MSSLLEQAIIDAKLLKETARKNAESALINKYAEKIRESVDLFLEQNEDGGAPDLGLPSAEEGSDSQELPGITNIPSLEPEIADTAKPTPEVKKVTDKIPASYLGEDNLQEVEINLDSIIEKIDSMEKELNMKTPDFDAPSHETVTENNEAEEVLDEASEDLEEKESLEEEIILDMENVSPGGIQGNEIELKKQVNIAKALEAQNEELTEEISLKEKELDMMEQKLQNAILKLQETRTKLKKSVEINTSLKENFGNLAKKTKEVILLNSRLLYTNKILGNSSLNERQKKEIAESISEAKTVEEAKTIYETLQRSAGAVIEKRSAPQSLTEALNKSLPSFLPRNQNAINPFKERMQILSGLKK